MEKVIVEKLDESGNTVDTIILTGANLADYMTSYPFENVQNDWRFTAYFIELRDVTVTKTWDDQNNKYNSRPESLTFTLTADGTALSDPAPIVTKNESLNNWVYTWKGLPRYHYNDDNVPVNVVYNAIEDPDSAKNYIHGELTMGTDGNYTITNKLETTNLNGAKTWDDGEDQDGIRPTSITVHVVDASGAAVGDPITVTPKEGHWTWTVSGLPKLDANGQEIAYSFTEDPITYNNNKIKEGYTFSIDGTTIINTHTPETIDIDVEKVWKDNNNADNKRPDSIQLTLVDMAGNEADADVNPITVSADTEWKGTFTHVPMKDGQSNTITYTVKEPTIPEYVSSVSAGTQISAYQYPTNISDVQPDQTETVSTLVNVPGGSDWHIQPGLTTDHIHATQVVFGSLNVAKATIKEYYADGAPVPNSERVFWKKQRGKCFPCGYRFCHYVHSV